MARAEDAKRVTVTLTPDEFQALTLAAGKKEMSINEYLKAALNLKIQWDGKDFPLEPLELARVNQLVDVVATLSSNIASLEGVVISGFDSLMGTTRGDNYLLDESGEDI